MLTQHTKLLTQHPNSYLQVGEPGEGLHADLALEPVLRPDVLTQLRRGGEDPEALGAAEVPGVRVALRYVNTKLAKQGKRLLALVTLVWLAVHVDLLGEGVKFSLQNYSQ